MPPYRKIWKGTYIIETICVAQILLSWDLRKSHDSNFGRILEKLIPNSRPYTAITSRRASKL